MVLSRLGSMRHGARRNRLEGAGTPVRRRRRAGGSGRPNGSRQAARALERRGEVRWGAARPARPGERERMLEREPVRVEELPRETEVAGRAVHGSPQTGSWIASRWTRIWLRLRLQPHVEEGALAEQLDHLEPRDGLCGSRRVKRVACVSCRPPCPIGAGIRPVRERSALDQGEVAPLDLALGDRLVRAWAAASERATRSRPDVSRSSRWTILGRSGPPRRAEREQAVREGRPPSGPEGCTTSRRACRRRAGARRRRPWSRARSTGTSPVGSGTSTSILPARQPVAFGARGPSTSTAPPPTSRSARARVPTAGSSATTASRRGRASDFRDARA